MFYITKFSYIILISVYINNNNLNFLLKCFRLNLSEVTFGGYGINFFVASYLMGF